MNKLNSFLATAGLLALAGLPVQAGIAIPSLVSAGMTGIEAVVPSQTGAAYNWTVANGTLAGLNRNAMVTCSAGTSGSVALTCTVMAAGVATVFTASVPVAPVLPVTPFFYGSGCSADSLANTVVGGPNGSVVSYRFQAKYTTPLKGCRVFFIWSATEGGYAAGDGGTVRVDLMADDHSPAHLPTGTALASTSITGIIAQAAYYPELVFPQPVALQGGALYHLVFTNLDPQPAANYISLDDLYTRAQTAPMQPTIADANWAVLYRAGAGPWKVRPGHTPTLELDYTTGSQGNGYMEVWSTNPKPISGAAQVREAFTVSGPSRTFTKVLLRLAATSGTSPLTVRVEEADGTLVDQVQVPSSDFLPGVSNWVTATFPVAHVLNSGVAYNLTLSSPSDTVYSAYPLRKGLDKGFSTSTVFPDGHAQFTTTGTWAGWDMWGTPGLKDSDLQFAFVD